MFKHLRNVKESYKVIQINSTSVIFIYAHFRFQKLSNIRNKGNKSQKAT